MKAESNNTPLFGRRAQGSRKYPPPPLPSPLPTMNIHLYPARTTTSAPPFSSSFFLLFLLSCSWDNELQNPFFLLLPDASGIKDSPFFSMKTTMSDDQSPTMPPLDSTLFSALTNDNGGRKRRRERKIPLCFGRGRNERACDAAAKCEMKPN